MARQARGYAPGASCALRMTHVDIVHAVYARLENRPGSLERAAKTLAQHKINVDGLSVETNGGIGFARLLTHKSKEAVEVLRKANVEAFESELAVVSLPNKQGELARACAELAAAGLNVEGVVTTPEGKLAFRTNDVERTAQILRKL